MTTFESDDLTQGLCAAPQRTSQSFHEDSSRTKRRSQSLRHSQGARHSSHSLSARDERPNVVVVRSDGSDELEDEKTRNRRSKRRFGKEINPKSYQTGQCIRMFAMVAAVLLVPVQILCTGLSKPVEQDLILHIQADVLPEYCLERGAWCNVLLSSSHYIFNRQECIVVIYILALVADSLLTFKTTILTTLGIYMLGMIQIAFKDGRPFWDVAAISSNGHCRLDFGSPNE